MSRIDEARRRAGVGASFSERIHGIALNPLDVFAAAQPEKPDKQGGENGRHQVGENARTQLGENGRRHVTLDLGGDVAGGRVRQQHVDLVLGERLVNQDDLGAHVEQYRRLAATLHEMQRERSIKTVMVTSARVGEGKTLTAANLSLTLSGSYRRRVLLVDADLRRPTLDTLLRVPSATGLSDCLREESRPLQATDITDSLTLVPGGKPDRDPMASLTSARMRQLLDQAASKFDWVVLDTPPLALLPDAHLLASMVQTIVFVIRAGSTPLAMVKRALDTLGPDKIAGVVLNRVENRVLAQDGYYGYDVGQRESTRRFFRFRADERQNPAVSALHLGHDSAGNGK